MENAADEFPHTKEKRPPPFLQATILTCFGHVSNDKIRQHANICLLERQDVKGTEKPCLNAFTEVRPGVRVVRDQGST